MAEYDRLQSHKKSLATFRVACAFSNWTKQAVFIRSKQSAELDEQSFELQFREPGGHQNDFAENR